MGRRRVICQNDIGATAVEYALGIGLVVIAVLAGLQTVSDGAEDKLNDRGTAIGSPDEVGGSTTGGTSGGTTGGATGGTTGGESYTGVVEANCTGGGNDKRNCVFALNPDPAPTVPTWQITPSSGFTGTLPSITFTEGGIYSVRGMVDDTEVQRFITCTENGAGTKVDCLAS